MFFNFGTFQLEVGALNQNSAVLPFAVFGKPRIKILEIIEILVVRFYKNIGQRFGQKIFGKTKIYETYINIKKKLQKKGKTNNNTH